MMGLPLTITLLCFLPLVQSFGNIQDDGTPIQINTLSPTAQPTSKATTPPTFKIDPDMFAVTFEEFDGGCSSTGGKASTCYTHNGVSYRFGCKKGDNGNAKIFTDTCQGGCNPDNCDNNWKWQGDEANQCSQVFGQSVFFTYTCHAPAAASGPDEVEPTVPEVKPKTCAQLGWLTSPGSEQICASSNIVAGRCSGEVDVFTARGYCSRLGARVCTAEELASDEAKGSGCKYDCERSWSSTKCTTEEGEQGFQTMAGARKCASKLPTRCDPFNAKAVVRCCANAANGDAPVVAGPQAYPVPYTPAISSDFPISDGECGKSTPTKEYSCWVNPADGTSQRFACRPGSQMVWVQSCGKSPNCEMCQGQWFTQEEEIGKCYSSDADTLYSYKCQSL